MTTTRNVADSPGEDVRDTDAEEEVLEGEPVDPKRFSHGHAQHLKSGELPDFEDVEPLPPTIRRSDVSTSSPEFTADSNRGGVDRPEPLHDGSGDGVDRPENGSKAIVLHKEAVGTSGEWRERLRKDRLLRPFRL